MKKLSIILLLSSMLGAPFLNADTTASCCKRDYTCCTYVYGDNKVAWSNLWVLGSDCSRAGVAAYQDTDCHSGSEIFGSHPQKSLHHECAHCSR